MGISVSLFQMSLGLIFMGISVSLFQMSLGLIFHGYLCQFIPNVSNIRPRDIWNKLTLIPMNIRPRDIWNELTLIPMKYQTETFGIN
jgi:hypothetical protein